MTSSTLRILFIGDIVGTPGMDAVAFTLPSVVSEHAVDLVIANGENAHDGKSISPEQARRLHDLGVQVITSGNHIWEKWHIQKLLAEDPYLLRPANYPKDAAGRGSCVVSVRDGVQVGVLNLQGRTFMSPIDCPFRMADLVLPRLRELATIIIVDMHAEATAEKMTLAWHLDGRVAAVVGTHTHVQTADARILPQGTAFITDVGMTGPYHSVVGMKKEIAIQRFIRQTPFKFEMATEDNHFSAVLIEADVATGHAVRIETLFLPEFSHVRSDH